MIARNHALWLGPLLAIVGLVSYFTVFYRWPVTRDVPWVNFAILLGALALSAVGLARAWPRGGWRRFAGVGCLVWSTGLAALFVASCTVMSALPPPAGVLDVGAPLPAVTLDDHAGTPVDLAAAGTQPLVLVFYRGFW